MRTQRERGDDAGDDGTADTLTRTRAFRLLSHVHRRALVDCLAGREAGMALADAASEVAARNLDRSVREASQQTIADVYSALHHSHVPRLVEAGVLEHDRDRNVVSLTERGRELAGIGADVGAADDGTPDAVR